MANRFGLHTEETVTQMEERLVNILIEGSQMSRVVDDESEIIEDQTEIVSHMHQPLTIRTVLSPNVIQQTFRESLPNVTRHS